MAHKLHIERDHPLTFSEFSSAVDQIPELRLVSGDVVGVNPRTFEEVTIVSKGATQVFDSEDNVWLREFEFRNGRVSWYVPENWKSWHLRDIAIKLSRLLKGRIVNDEGEAYQ